jgi:hypothetical protein
MAMRRRSCNGAEVMKNIVCAFTVTACLLAGCAGSDPADRKIGDQLQVEAAPGWQHHRAHSKFHLGDMVVEDRTVTPLLRYVGSHGVFAENLRSGASMGISNADSPAAVVPDVLDAEALRSTTLSYFLASGMPRDQLAPYGISLKSGGSGSGSGVTTQTYTATADRVLEGDLLVDGFAYAEFNVGGETKSEGVFWPEIPGQAIADARALRAAKDDPAFRARIEATVPGTGAQPGTVIIHHSGQGADVIVARASYDVALGPVIHHFDLEGHEVPLP